MESDQIRVLVVDDEPDLCWALDLMLRPLGLQVTTAACGAEALGHVAHESYDLIFVDAILPDIAGISLAQMIGQLNPQAALILMSGYYYPEDPAVGASLARAHFVDFLAKPFRLADVRRVARRALTPEEKSVHGACPGC